MGDILRFNGMTCIEVPVEELLEKAKEWGMVKALVVGMDAENELCFGGSFSDTPLINILLDHAKISLLTDSEFNGERHG